MVKSEMPWFSLFGKVYCEQTIELCRAIDEYAEEKGLTRQEAMKEWFKDE